MSAQQTDAKVSPLLVNLGFLCVGFVLLYASVSLGNRCPTDLSDPIRDVLGIADLACKPIRGLAFFLKEIGFAAIVAVFLNLSIETFNRKRHHKEKAELISELNEHHNSLKNDLSESIAKNIFATIYKRKIPDEMFMEVENLLLKQDTHRSDYRVKFSLTKCPENANKISVDRSQSFTLTNISEDEAEISIPFFSDAPPDTAKYVQNTFTIISDKGKSHYDLQELIEKGEASYEEGFYSSVVKAKIPEGKSIQVIEHSVGLRELIGSEVMCSMIPSDGMTISVETPNADIEVIATSLHLRDVTLDKFEESPCTRRWLFPYPLLPGQGIMIIWKPVGVGPSYKEGINGVNAPVKEAPTDAAIDDDGVAKRNTA